MGLSIGDIKAKEVCKAIHGDLLSGDLEALIHGICTDTRTLRTGELFWALKGERFDGHDYVEQAFHKGAGGVVGNAEKMGRFSIPAGTLAISVSDTLKALGDMASWWRKAPTKNFSHKTDFTQIYMKRSSSWMECERGKGCITEDTEGG